jgi:DNA-binding NtrC family response regulator
VATYPLFGHQEKFNGCVIVVKDETKLVELESDLRERQQLQNIIGKSEKIQKIYSSIEALAEVQTTVLITGENGTGKGLVAEALHYHKKSSKNPFVVVNCTSLSDNLLESELFGHVKGAFTGAVSDRIGRFQKANSGTIFLDEIGDITNTMQLRLLKVLQDQEFERVGDSTSIKVNVRIIAATNQDLRKKVRQGKFREDLYHRLKVMELTIPPLRERREDIPLLVDHFLEKFNKKFNKNIKAISIDVQKIFMEYKWPGNVRELQHALENAFVLCNHSFITIDNLPSEFQNLSTAGIRHLEKRKPYDRHTITQALKETGWNKAKAARLLGIGRRTIYLKIKEYDITEMQ